MTDPAPRPRRGARWDVDGRSLRLWVVAGLATTYLIAWWSFAPAPAATSTSFDAPAETPTARGPTTVWWSELPPGDRPVVTLPPGWEIATAAPPRLQPVSAAPTPRARPTRRVRIRTRSS
ncbi:MAG: hypothetical protein IPL61_29735 [Myxococcales bacterium]|nr:hypothetical protein [Myxococcales bacterium]